VFVQLVGAGALEVASCPADVMLGGVAVMVIAGGLG
jgi:hypothetical protein